MSVEWMNVLPVTQPVVGARPRVLVDPTAFGPAAKFDQVGLRSTEISAAGAAGAVADFQLGTALEGAGNPKAAQFFLDRARTASPNLTKTLEGDGAAAPAPPQPARAVSGGGPVLVGTTSAMPIKLRRREQLVLARLPGRQAYSRPRRSITSARRPSRRLLAWGRKGPARPAFTSFRP